MCFCWGVLRLGLSCVHSGGSAITRWHLHALRTSWFSIVWRNLTQLRKVSFWNVGDLLFTVLIPYFSMPKMSPLSLMTWVSLSCFLWPSFYLFFICAYSHCVSGCCRLGVYCQDFRTDCATAALAGAFPYENADMCILCLLFFFSASISFGWLELSCCA